MPLKQVLVGAGEGIEALAGALRNHITVGAGIDGDLLERQAKARFTISTPVR